MDREIKRLRVAILGSTGSIGTQALQVIEDHPDQLEVFAITANNNVDLLIQQALKFQPEVVIIANEKKYEMVKEALNDLPIKVFTGAKSIADMVQMEPIDIVLTAMVGYAGLYPTIKAIEAGKRIALANKETMVVAGDLISKLCTQYKAPIYPVDSEHSAIYQSLMGEDPDKLEKILLTASGGPFRGKDRHFLETVKASDALKHPNWSMGAKITIDSASMMNKGFEVIEAKWLFDVPLEKIQVVVHPQSLVHSMVQYTDGAIIAQLGMPDMRLPIELALGLGYRLHNDYPRLDLFTHNTMTFEAPDPKTFRNLALAYQATKAGGNTPCVLNAANEVVVALFLKDKIGFLQMSDVIEQTLQATHFIEHPSYEDYVATHKWATEKAEDIAKKYAL